ncbi:MAG: hypothetical protein IJK42_08125 [Prevotella sp.]|nr:hypothetical protein [Prevotella sp.]
MEMTIKHLKFFLIWAFVLLAMPLMAQQRPETKFDPARFDAEMEQFITTEVGLNPKEASQFFPVFREMLKKQRVVFAEMRRYRHVDTNDDKACCEAIRKRDELDIQIKEIQQEYDNKFLKILPAGKVMGVIKAEEKFHRQAFKSAAKHDRGRK